MPTSRPQSKQGNGNMARPAPKGGSLAASKAEIGQGLMLEEAQLRVLRLIEDNPQISQREIAEQLNLSLGKANYCIHALIDLGWLKARNFKNSANKLAYAYALTPRALKQRADAMLLFLDRKRSEYETLRAEIELLEKELLTHQARNR